MAQGVFVGMQVGSGSKIHFGIAEVIHDKSFYGGSAYSGATVNCGAVRRHNSGWRSGQNVVRSFGEVFEFQESEERFEHIIAFWGAAKEGRAKAQEIAKEEYGKNICERCSKDW